MGTETGEQSPSLSSLVKVAVKLNNPLMGTETMHRYRWLLYHMRKFVKLNNPLMGTETQSETFSNRHTSLGWLN